MAQQATDLPAIEAEIERIRSLGLGRLTSDYLCLAMALAL
jgi:hypothetical protein